MRLTGNRVAVGAALLAGPLLWMGHLLASYGLLYLACSTGGRVWLHVATVVALGTIGVVVVLGWRNRQQVRSVWVGGLGGAGDPPWRVLGLMGWLLAVYFLLVTAMAGLASILVDPCL